jgi:acyl-CoA dehydrogenase
VLDEIHALEDDDRARFDRAFFRHVGHPFVLVCRSLLLGLTGGRLARPPREHAGPLTRELRHLSRLSAAFALASEGAMMTLGGGLKLRERITGRLADALAWQYLAATVLAQFEHAGRPERELPLARAACERAVDEIERALAGTLDNLPLRPVAWCLRRLCFPYGTPRRSDDDRLGTRIAEALLSDEILRGRLTRNVYVPAAGELGLGVLEDALVKARRAREAEAKVRHALRDGVLDELPADSLAQRAVAAGILDEAEAHRFEAAAAARREAVRVDSFPKQGFATRLAA